MPVDYIAVILSVISHPTKMHSSQCTLLYLHNHIPLICPEPGITATLV